MFTNTTCPPALTARRAAVRDARASLDAWFVQDAEGRREVAASVRALLRQAEQDDVDGSVTRHAVQAVRDLISRQGTSLVALG